MDIDSKWKNIIGPVETDVSGKWIRVEDIEQIVIRTVVECAKMAHISKYGIDATRVIRQRFGVSNTDI